VVYFLFVLCCHYHCEGKIQVEKSLAKLKFTKPHILSTTFLFQQTETVQIYSQTPGNLRDKTNRKACQFGIIHYKPARTMCNLSLVKYDKPVCSDVFMSPHEYNPHVIILEQLSLYLPQDIQLC